MRGGLTDFYNMLQTGLVDAALLWPEAAKTFKIAEVAPYMLRADLGAVNSKTITVNKDFWEKLPAEAFPSSNRLGPQTKAATQSQKVTPQACEQESR